MAGNRPGPGQHAGFSTVTLKPSSGDIHLKLRPRPTSARSSVDVVAEGRYESGEAVPTKDVPRRHRMFPRGAGWSSRPGAFEDGESWDGFAEAENACLRFGYICPSGEQTATAIDPTWGGVAAMLRFNDDLFVIFGSRIAFIDGATGVLSDLYTNAGDIFTGAELWNGALRVSLLCTHTNPNQHFFVTVTVGAPYTVLNPTPAAPAGTGATALTPPLRLVRKVFWEYQGVAAFRMLGQVTDYTFQYMIAPDGDPYDPANWGATVQVGDQTYPIRRIVTSHDTAWFLKRDGVYAVSDANASAGGENLTPYWADQLDDDDSYINGYFWGQYLVASHAFGIDLIDVNSWQVKDRPRQVAIGFGRPNNTNLNGFYTAFCADNGWLVAGMRSVVNDCSYVLYGTLRHRESPAAGVTDVDWFPEVGPLTSGRDITCLAVFTPASGRPSLWIGLVNGLGQPSLVTVELFLGSSPLADTGHRYNTTTSVTFTDEHWSARGATKSDLRVAPSVRNCGSGRKVDIYLAVGATSSFGGSPHASITTNVETQTFSLTATRGSVIRSKAILTSTATVPVVIDEWELKADLYFPLWQRGTWLVETSDATEGDLPSVDAPRSTEAALLALCESGEVVEAIDDEGTAGILVALDNVLPWRREDSPSTDLGTHQKTRLLEVAWKQVG